MRAAPFALFVLLAVLVNARGGPAQDAGTPTSAPPAARFLAAVAAVCGPPPPAPWGHDRSGPPRGVR